VAGKPEQLVLFYDPARCTGCRYCEMACSYKHYGVLDFNKARRHVVFDPEHVLFEAVQCRHCEEPVCASVCPTEAIRKDEKTGWVLINPMKCIGCRSCVVSCPMGVPWFDEDLKVGREMRFLRWGPVVRQVLLCPGHPGHAEGGGPGAHEAYIRGVSHEGW